MRQAIEGARALMPLLEQRHAEQLGPIRDTLSRLQMVYAQQAGGAGRGARARAELTRRGSSPSRRAPGPAAELRSALDSGPVTAAFRLNAR